jgi:hypothetical protein
MYFPLGKIPRDKLILIGTGIIIGFLSFAGLRAALLQQDSLHYHANFGLFVNGQRDEFDNFTFYEEVQSCSANENHNPKLRVHMHNNINNVVHVHDENVTWAAFFANLGYGLTDKALQTDDGVLVDGQGGKQLRFVLNGEMVDTIANKVIANEDVLLVDYGPDSVDLDLGYKQIRRDAHRYNETADPATCSGEEPLDFSERIRRAFDFDS